MDGKSHDELHKWLHPQLELVKELENEIDVVKANEIVLQLQKSNLFGNGRKGLPEWPRSVSGA
jgi:hypothetical protein